MKYYESEFVADRIKQLLKAQKISASKMLRDLEMNKNALYTMQSGGFLPRLEAVAQIADYLNAPVDYLLGRTDDPVPMSKPDILYKRPDGSFIFLETKGINTPLSPEQEDKVYKLLEVAMPELVSDTND